MKQLIVFFFLLSDSVFAQSVNSKNLVSNPGFEDGSKSWVIKTAKVDHSIKHSGKSSLMYINTNPKIYNVIITHIAVKGGEILDFSSWIKGRNIKPENNFAKKGAGIYVHAYDANGKSLGGSNPPTMAGNFEWTKVEGRFEIPKNAKKLAIGLYLVQGNTGTVWFDDVTVSKRQSEGISTVSTISSNEKKGEIYIDSQGFTVKNNKRIFPFGIYLGKGLKQGPWASSNPNLRKIKSAGFNTILSYYYGDRSDAEKYLDQAGSLGLNVIYSLADMYEGSASYTDQNMRVADKVKDLVNRLKNKPALLSWYSGDEITSSHILAAEKNYELIKNLDNNHPVFQVNNKPNFISSLLSSADVVGSDPYPISTSSKPNLKLAGDWTTTTVSKARGKGVWQVVQIFNMGAYQSKNKSAYLDPSEYQIRNMLFQSVIQGAKGILFYSFHDLYHGIDASGKAIFSEADFEKRWRSVEKVSKEFNQIIPIILANDTVQLPNLKTTANLQTKAWKYNGKTYIMAVNTSTIVERLTVGNVVLTFQGNEAKFFILEDLNKPTSLQTSMTDSLIPTAFITQTDSSNEFFAEEPIEKYVYFKDSYQWILEAFGFQPNSLDQAIQICLTV